MGKVLTYVHNQWEKLIVYCEDGRLNISNVLAENVIRPFVVGKPGFLVIHPKVPMPVESITV